MKYLGERMIPHSAVKAWVESWGTASTLPAPTGVRRYKGSRFAKRATKRGGNPARHG